MNKQVVSKRVSSCL